MRDNLRITILNHRSTHSIRVVFVGTDGNLLCRTLLAYDVGRDIAQWLRLQQLFIKVVGRFENVVGEEFHLLVDIARSSCLLLECGEVTCGA